MSEYTAKELRSDADWLEEYGADLNRIKQIRAHADLIERVAYLENRLELFADGKRVPDSRDGIACRDETIKLQDERIAELETALLGVKEYREKNPLGGPAKRFDAVADAIRAGMDYKAAMAEFGLCEESEFDKLKAHAEAMAETLDKWATIDQCKCSAVAAYRAEFKE